jgi:hypothetical protein
MDILKDHLTAKTYAAVQSAIATYHITARECPEVGYVEKGWNRIPFGKYHFCLPKGEMKIVVNTGETVVVKYVPPTEQGIQGVIALLPDSFLDDPSEVVKETVRKITGKPNPTNYEMLQAVLHSENPECERIRKKVGWETGSMKEIDTGRVRGFYGYSKPGGKRKEPMYMFYLVDKKADTSIELDIIYSEKVGMSTGVDISELLDIVRSLR